MDQQIDMLLMSYELSDLLEENDVTEEYVVKLLIDLKLIKLEDYFDAMENE